MGDVTGPDRWRRLTVAVLVGLTTTGVLAFFATLFQTPGLEGPIELAPIAVMVTVLGSIALPLVRWDDPVGYGGAALAGSVAVLGVALYLAGVFGPTRVAPAAYLFALLGGLVAATTAVSWRERPARRRA